jgi:hypothetical protein
MEVAVLEGPHEIEEAAWHRVYVLSNASIGPSDYISWLPEAALEVRERRACAAGRDIAALSALDPFTRARCVGPGALVLRGWVRDRALPTWYGVSPAWFGNQNGDVDSTISLAEIRRRGGFEAADPLLEVQVPPGVEVPPFGLQVAAIVHVGDPRSTTCERRPDPFGMVPPEAREFAPIWCSTRLVIEGWVALLGPEERPIDRLRPQLHRHPDAGGNPICAGVGMGQLVFRIDAAAVDPVWLEPVDRPGTRIIPNFDPGFHTAFEPDLVVKDELGRVVARDGTPVDPDGQLAGHFICPTGRVVYFD